MTRTPEQIDTLVAEARGMMEPVAWIVRDGLYRDQAFLDRQLAQRRAEEREMNSDILPLFAASPTLLTDLLAVVEQLREENARMREALVRISRETAEDHIGDTWVTPAAMVARAAITDKEQSHDNT